MQHLEGSDTPVLYIGRTVLKDYTYIEFLLLSYLPTSKKAVYVLIFF
jgi:hypothetical protein